MSISRPAARQTPSERTFHGDTVVDEYAWLADKDDPETIAFLEAENAYTEALTAGQEGLREEIFGEIKARTQETDLSVPMRKGGWWYYARTVEGQQYGVFCRRAVRPDDSGPPMSEDGAPLDGEEVLLDSNQLAGDQQFFSLGARTVSPDGRLLAYSTDFAGNERFTLRIKDLATGETTADEIPDTFYGPAWSRDGSALFYVTVDDAWRPYRVWRHMVGTPAAQDALVYEEADEKFRVGIGLTRSERYLLLSVASSVTSEVWLLDAATPEGEFTVVAPRRQNVEYQVEHQVGADGTDRLLILHNDGAENFELVSAPVSDPADRTTVIAPREDTRLLDVDAFAEFLAVSLRRDGLTGLRIIRADGSDYEVAFPEPVYTVFPGANPEYSARLLRLSYGSLVTPDSVYDCDMATGELTLLKRFPVLPLPGGAEYRPGDYEQYREWATASDGTRIPISLVCRKGTPRDGSSPFVLYGYGSYEASMDPSFSISRLSLLDRGFGYAIAHVRGGGEMGRHWYEDGKLLHKANTFTDFVACAEHLAAAGWTSPRRLIARGASAGGLLMGAVANLAPQDFGGIVAQVPFVDPLTTILDPSLPLTVTEWEEWGDPLHDPRVYAYMKAYSPYENVTGQAYPPILAVTSLNDTRVLYSEPAKWVARLQARASGGPFLLKTEMVAGHGGRSGRYDRWREDALILAWIVTVAGATTRV
ncbi:MAG TPA: S9 family peptidase [Streptosporangiaceae bacterium]|nr:S9 family peptidase [Streptosporangiaceae bacterium]